MQTSHKRIIARTIMIMATLLAVFGSGLAQEPEAPSHPIEVALGKCLASKKIVYERAGCFSAELDSWNKEVDVAYEGLLKVVAPKFVEPLKETQKAWKVFRDKELLLLEVENPPNATGRGTGYVSHRIAAESEIIKPRAIYLRKWLDAYNQAPPLK